MNPIGISTILQSQAYLIWVPYHNDTVADTAQRCMIAHRKMEMYLYGPDVVITTHWNGILVENHVFGVTESYGPNDRQ